MKKNYVYNKIGVPVEYLEIEGVEKYIHYEKEEFYYNSLDTLWLRTVRENTSNVVIEMNKTPLNIMEAVYSFPNCNFYFVYRELEEIKGFEYITIDRISYEKALELLEKKYPKLKNKEENAKLLSLGKKSLANISKTMDKGNSLGF